MKDMKRIFNFEEYIESLEPLGKIALDEGLIHTYPLLRLEKKLTSFLFQWNQSCVQG